MKKILIALMLTGVLFGCAKKDEGLSTSAVKASLEKSIPGLPADISVNKSPVNGIYEVVVGRKVFYVTNDGKYIMFGNLIEAATKQNLTEKRTTELSKIDWNKLPFDLAIKEVNGNGKRKLAVFSDPECPYCQMFEKEIAPKLTDTTIYTFLFPLPSHPQAKPDAIKIWCAKDRSSVWTSWMRDKKALPTNSSCDISGIDKLIKVGTDLVQIEGTPTLILENGQILPGMVPAEQLIPMMDNAVGGGKVTSSVTK